MKLEELRQKYPNVARYAQIMCDHAGEYKEVFLQHDWIEPSAQIEELLAGLTDEQLFQISGYENCREFDKFNNLHPEFAKWNVEIFSE